jgi:hypothetical protein
MIPKVTAPTRQAGNETASSSMKADGVGGCQAKAYCLLQPIQSEPGEVQRQRGYKVIPTAIRNPTLAMRPCLFMAVLFGRSITTPLLVSPAPWTLSITAYSAELVALPTTERGFPRQVGYRR